MKFWAVVPAAGSGRRMGGGRPKQYLTLGDRPVLEHTLERLASVTRIGGIVVARPPADPYWAELNLPPALPLHVVDGGTERCHSVANALALLATFAGDGDWVLVHDAARPCIRPDDVARLMTELEDDPVGGLLAIPIVDTVKRTDRDGRVEATVPRDRLWRAATPQMFRLGLLREALRAATVSGHSVTDEAAAMEWAGHRPAVVEGAADNIKITRPEDLRLAQLLMGEQERERADRPGI